MDYKSSIAIFLEITFGFLTPVPPSGFRKNFFKIEFLKVARNIKLATLITNIGITNLRHVMLKYKTGFTSIGLYGPNLVFDPPSHMS